MDKEQLKQELKSHIIKYLNLLEMTPESIGDSQPFLVKEALVLTPLIL